MSGFRLLSLGVGDAFSALYYSSCFALEAGGEWLLVDSPHPIRKIVREGALAAGLVLDVDRLGALVLTHLHGDHASGVEGLAFYFRYVLGRKLPVITHPDIAAHLWTKHLAGSMEWSLQTVHEPPIRHTADEFLDIIPLVESQALAQGPFSLSCRKTIHNIPTIALIIRAAGRTLGYSADTAYDPSLIDWLSPADLIVHEACGRFMHTPYESLLALPQELRAKMRILHCPDSFDVGTSAIEALRQGEIYNV
jgi:phosphoribosyl 1,2-cyclic phosphodiesterase